MPSDCQPIVASHLGRNRKAYLLLLKIDFPLQILAALSQCLDPGGRPRLSEDAFLADALLGQEVNDPGEDQWHLKNKFSNPSDRKHRLARDVTIGKITRHIVQLSRGHTMPCPESDTLRREGST